MKILGFQSGHDVSYCILDNGVPIIHEELERFIREKEPMGDGLEMALQRIPEETLKNIKYFSHGNPGGRTGGYKEKCGKEDPEKQMKDLIKHNDGKYFIVGHHQSHAANAFFSSNYDEALIVTIDGSGTDKTNHNDVTNESYETDSFSTAFTFWEGKGNKIKPILRIPMEKLTLGSPWRVYTREIFELSSGHPHGLAAGTIMAMASVGNSEKYYKDFYNAFINGGGGASPYTMNNCKKYKEIAKISEQEKFDIAAGIQKATELVVYEIMKPMIDKYKPTNYVLERLLGIRNEELEQFKSNGYNSRIYIVYGKEWYLYLCNRWAEYPLNIFQGIADIVD